jgi:hypothetical protein
LRSVLPFSHPSPVSLFACLLASPQAEGYDPRKSKVSNDVMEQWRTCVIDGDLKQVPGIGPAAVKKLADSANNEIPIHNTWQLFGQYLMLKGVDDNNKTVDAFDHTERFWFYLKSRGIASHRSAIVKVRRRRR